MILTSTDSVPGAQTAEVLGLVREVLGLARGNTVRARNVGRDITQGLRNLAGSEPNPYSSLLSDTRNEAFSRIAEDASKRAADAIVNVRSETARVTDGGAEQVTGGGEEIPVYGTTRCLT